MVKSSDQHNSRKRRVGRGAEDLLVRDIIDHQRRLLHVGQIITSEMNLELLFPLSHAASSEDLLEGFWKVPAQVGLLRKSPKRDRITNGTTENVWDHATKRVH